MDPAAYAVLYAVRALLAIIGGCLGGVLACVVNYLYGAQHEGFITLAVLAITGAGAVWYLTRPRNIKEE